MNDLKIFAPISYPFMLFFMAVLAMWFVGKNSQEKLDYHLPSLIEDSYTCTMGNNLSAEKLTVYMNTQTIARALADLLCDDPVVQRQYHQVQAYWGTGDVSDITFIGKGLGDLVNTKDNIVQAFDAENTHGYERLAGYSK